MMKMINKRRVQRIKSLIYAFIILLMLLPLVLMSILSFQMFGAIKDLNVKVDNLSKLAASQAASQNPADSPEPDSGYVIEPNKQASRPDGETTQGTTEPEQPQDDAADDLSANKENLSASPDGGMPAGGSPGADKPSVAGNGNELGGGAPIEDSESSYLAAAGGGSSNQADKELASNPQMGYGDNAPVSDYTINPSTGS